MVYFFLILSSVFFISSCGIHLEIMNENEFDRPPYTRNKLIVGLLWISGFVFPVISWVQITELHWLALFFINMALVIYIGPNITEGYLKRLASGKGLGQDMITAFVAGVVTLLIGLIL